METEIKDLIEKQIIHMDLKPKSSFHPYWAKGKHIPTFYEVVMDEIKNICQKCQRHYYLAEALRLLGDKYTYAKLPEDLLPDYTITLEQLLDRARKEGMN